MALYNIYYNKAFNKLMKHEGGYVNDPKDPGGETVAGISRRFHPRWKGWQLVDDMIIPGNIKADVKIALRGGTSRWSRLFRDSIKEFYYNNYWKKLNCDKMPYDLAAVLFDTGVNMGKVRAAKMLQELWNRSNNIPCMLKVDGKIGLRTLLVVEELYADPGNVMVVNTYIEDRIEIYFDLCEAKPVKYKFLRGWLRRCADYIVVEGV